MTTQSSRRALQLRLWALFMFFFIPGLLMASWATRTPAIRDLLALSTAEMGVVLFGLSVGSMSGILCSAWLVKRFGTRKVIRTTMSFAVLGMLVLSLALWVTSAPLFAFGLAIFGASFGSAEVAINVEGAAIEREMNKTVLPMMHGFYSFGTLFGAGVGMAVTGFGLPAAPHILAAALVAILPIAIAIRAIPDGTGKNAAEVAHGEAKGLPVWRDAQLLLIGVIVLAMAFAEGSANDWLPLLMVDGHGFSPTSGSLIYAGFTLGMTLGRFTGGWFIDRYSRVAVVRGSAVMGALGIGLIIFVDNPWVAGISVLLWGIGASLGFPLTISAASDTGPDAPKRVSAVMGALGIGLIIFVDNPWVAGISVLLWGIGASLGFPLTISAASDTGPDAPKRVSVVAITGYLAFLVGPPLLGFLGEHFGLRSAMMVVLGLVMVAALVARAVAKPQSEPVMENS
ncbi:MFS transporter [Klebsiella pneumoniae]|uniref:MFS transporter n=1 Tax=Klebsiella pneumoniae TaxID=573 RepID=UPI0039B0DE81